MKRLFLLILQRNSKGDFEVFEKEFSSLSKKRRQCTARSSCVIGSGNTGKPDQKIETIA